MRIASALFSLVVFLAAAPAFAADCSKATDQASLNRCADQNYKAVDARLNATYRQITARLKDDPEKTKLLVSAQKAWIAFRDAECRFAASGVEGGSIHPMTVSDCLASLTGNRIEALKGYLSCEEGDLSCPVPAN